MKPKILLFFAAVFYLFVGNVVAQASTYPYSDFVRGLDDITTAQFSSEKYTVFYRNGTPVYGSSATTKGSIQLQSNSEAYDSKSIVKGVESTEDESFEVTMNFIRSGDTIYIQFKNPSDKDLRGKWIALSLDEYKDFGDALGMPNLFNAAEVSNMNDREIEIMQKTVTLAEKHDLFTEYRKPTTQGKKGKKTISYYIEINPDKATAFYQDLELVLTDEEEKNSVLSIPGFKDAVKNKYFLTELTEESGTVLTFDVATMRPVEFTDYFLIPAFGTRKEVIETGSSFKFTNPTKKITWKIPSKTISAEQALALLKN